MKAKTKIIFGSAMTAAMCASLIAGSTFALFTSEAKTNIAITAGKVSIEATVSEIQAWHSEVAGAEEENYDGTYKYVPDDVSGTVESGFSANFGADGAYGSLQYAAGTGLTLERFTPGNKVELTLTLNNASNVTIRFQVQLNDMTAEEEKGEHPLIEGLSMKMGETGKEATFSGGAIATAWSDPITAGTPLSDINLTVELPITAGNEYQSEKANLTLTVLAVQGNAAICAGADSETGHLYTDSHRCFYCGKLHPLAEFFGDDGTAFFNETEDSVTISGVPEGTTEISVPGRVNGKPVQIGANAFKDNKELTSVTLGDGVASIGEHAFDGCSSLTDVALPDSVTEIADFAFNECTALSGIGIPDNVTRIGQRAFYDCYGMTHVTLSEDSALTTIGGEAFARNFDLTSITIPNNVTTINDQAFYQCYRLVEVYDFSAKLNLVPESKENGGAAYYALSVVTSAETTSRVKVDDDGFVFYEDGESVYLIGYQGKATEIVLPEQSASGKPYDFIKPQPHALYNLLEVTSITLPESMTAIPDYMIQNCPKLTNVNIPDGVVSIGMAAFNACTSLTSITIPASVTEIKQAAFVSCRGLQHVTIEGDGSGLTIAAGAGTGSAFYACTALESITFGGTEEQFDALLAKGNFLKNVIDSGALASLASLTVTVTCSGGATARYVCNRGEKL